MKDKEMLRLVKASNCAAEKEVRHILIIKNQDGTVKVTGSGDIVTAMVGNQELFNQVKNVVQTSQGPAGISGFSNEIMKSIILSMLAAAEIDPNTHVVPQEEVGEHVGLPPVEPEQVADQVPAPAEIEAPAEQVIVQQDEDKDDDPEQAQDALEQELLAAGQVTVQPAPEIEAHR